MSDEKKDVTNESTEDETQTEAPSEEGSKPEDAAESKDATAEDESASDDAAEDESAGDDAAEDESAGDDKSASEPSDKDDEPAAEEAGAASSESDADEEDDEDEAHDSDGHDSDGHDSDPHDSDGHDDHGHGHHHGHHDDGVLGVAAFFDHPDHLVYAATQARDAEYEAFDAFSPFPIHGMDDAMGLGRSWIPWVTFIAGATGFTLANILQFGIMAVDWPMVYGGKPIMSWPSFVPVMFELTVLLAGVTTAVVMLVAAGCFRKPLIIDPGISNDRFVLWISSEDGKFDRDRVVEFMKELNPMEIRTVRKEGRS